MGEPIKQDKQSEKVTTQYKEMNRDGSSYTAQRQPPTKRMDFLPQIKRKEVDRIK
jgi:hypothetical protein